MCISKTKLPNIPISNMVCPPLIYMKAPYHFLKKVPIVTPPPPYPTTYKDYSRIHSYFRKNYVQHQPLSTAVRKLRPLRNVYITEVSGCVLLPYLVIITNFKIFQTLNLTLGWTLDTLYLSKALFIVKCIY